MMVITRKKEQGVWIGPIYVKVLRSGAGGVRLGIEAPEDVKIIRDELAGPSGLPKDFRDNDHDGMS